MSRFRQAAGVSVPAHVVRGKQQERGPAILLHLLTLVMAHQAIPMVGGVATTTAAVGTLLASQAAQAQTAPAKPTGFRVVERNAALILVWTKPASVNKWEYQYQEGSGQWTDWQEIINPKASGTIRSYKLPSLTNGTSYKVKIRAVSGTTPGPASDEDSGTPDASRVPGVTLGVTDSLSIDDPETFTGSGTWYLADGSVDNSDPMDPSTADLDQRHSYTMALNAEPAGGDVTITVAGAGSYITVHPSTLTFTKDDWNTAQTIKVAIPFDANIASETVTLSHSATGGSYDSVKILSLTIKTLDSGADPDKPASLNAIPGNKQVTLKWTDKFNLYIEKWQYRQKSAGGSWGSWTDISSAYAPQQRRHTVSSLTNDTEYTFQIRSYITGADSDGDGADDAEPNGYSEPSDEAKATPKDPEVNVTIEPDAITMTEGKTWYYIVRLNSQPAGNVIVTPRSNPSGVVNLGSINSQGSFLNSPVLIFSTSNWDTFQTVKVTSQVDSDTEDKSVTISHTLSGASYGATPSDVTVTVKNVHIPSPGVIVTSDRDPLTEGGAAGSYTVKLSTQPSGSVTVTPASEDTAAATVSAALTFTTTNWDTVKTVTVTPEEDPDITNERLRITNTVSGASDYASLEADYVAVFITDDDEPGLTVAYDPAAPAEVAVTEGGSAGTYTVVLDTLPTANVTVTPTSGDTGAVMVSSALIFTTANWDTARTVTVTPVDDPDTTDESVTVSNAASGAAEYVSVSADATVKVTDNDEPDLTVSLSELSLSEGGEAKTYTVKLATEPSASVTVTPAIEDAAAATVSAALTFTTSDYTVAQTVTVSPVDDDDAKDESVPVKHTVTGASEYAALTAEALGERNVTVSVDDDEIANLTIVTDPASTPASEAKLSLTEGGSAKTYTVVLTAPPTGSVTLTPESSKVAAVTVSAALTFTTSDWSTAQTVTVAPVEDPDAADETVTVTHTATGATEYVSVSEDESAGLKSVAVAVADDETAGVTVTPTDLSLTEGGSAKTYTVVLDTQPVGGDVTLTPASGDTTAAMVSAALTFTATDWSTAQTVTVTPVDDDDATDESGITLTNAVSGADYGSVTVGNVTVAVADDETVGVTVTPAELSLTEGRKGETYTVKLDTEPTGNVTVTPTSPDTGAVMVSSALTFSTVNWDAQQTVTVTPVADDDETDESVTVSNAASGADYGSVSKDVTVAVEDNDDAGVTVSIEEDEELELTEGGSTGSYTVKLDKEPTANVVVTATSPDPEAVMVSSALTFTTTDWSTAQTVTVTPVDDDDPTNETVTLTHAVSGSGEYAGVTTASSVMVTVTDDDEPGVTFDPVEVTVTEGGGTETYTVVLDTLPTGSVTLTPTSDDSGAATVSSALTFSTVNWDTQQTVTVTPVGDDDEADETVTVTHTVSGADYASVTAEDVTVTVTDDDELGVTVSMEAMELREGGAAGSYTVVLDTLPSGSVTVTPTSDNSNAVTVSSALTFTTTDWNAAQTVMVTAVEDDDINGETVTVSNAVSGANYDSVTAGSVTVSVEDNEPGVTVSSLSPATLIEGNTGTYTVRLTTIPEGGDVMLTPSSGDTDAVTVAVPSGTALTFTTANWNTAQTVRVMAEHDDDASDPPSPLTVSNAVSGANYDSVRADSVTVTVIEDDSRGVSITPMDGIVTINEGSTGIYTVVLDAKPTGGNVTVTPTSGNSNAVTVSMPSGNALTFTPEDWATLRTVTVTSVDNGKVGANSDVMVSNSVSGSDYGAVTAKSVTVKVIDDDEAGVQFNPASRMVEVAEGEMVTYGLKLKEAPTAGNVTVEPTSADAKAVRVVSGALTFTPITWDTEQLVTVMAVGDNDAEDESVTVTHAVSGLGNYAGVRAKAVIVKVTDDNTPGVTVISDNGRVTVNEGSIGTYRVVLNTQPSGNVRVIPTSEDTTAVMVSAELTFTPTNWNTAQTVMVATNDNKKDEDDRTLVIRHVVSGYGDVETAADVSMIITDNDNSPVLERVEDQTVMVNEQVSITATATDADGDPITYAWSRKEDETIPALPDGTVLNEAELRFRPTAIGTYTMMVTASDPHGNSDEEEVSITVSSPGDDDGEPSLSIATPAAVTEGNRGSTNMLFTVNLAPAAGQEVTVEYGVDTTTSTATADTDFTDLSGTLTFAAGEISKTITVSVTGDAVDEPDETVVLKLSNASNATIGTATATGTITDDDGEPSLSIAAPAAVTEGDSGSTDMVFTVNLAPAAGQEVTVEYGVDTTTSTATADTDFTDLSGTLTFAAGETSKTITVAVTGDAVDEPDETVVLKLSNASNAAIGTATATGTITDDDGEPSLSIAAPAAVTEGNRGSTNMLFTVNLAPAAGQEVTVEYGVDASSTATADTDFTDLSGTLTFAAGETSKTITVSVTGDAVDEPDETVVLKLSNASNAAIGTATATGTITDDDGEPSLSIAAPAAVTEGNRGSTNMLFTVNLAPAAGQEVTVDYGVDASSTATVDTDFTDLSGTLTFAVGETSKTITVSVTGDAVDEPDETVVLKLSNASNAAIGMATATGTITDDDEPSLSIAASAAVTEGDSGSTDMVFTVNLAPAAGQEVTVDYGVDASSTATVDTDFTDLSGTLTFAVGETSKTITVSVTGDAVDEPDETVVLKLSNASNAAIGMATATGTITDDDEPSLSIAASAAVTEGDSGSTDMVFTITLAPASDQEVTVEYGVDTIASTATADTDFTDLSGTLTFAAGETSKTITVSVTGDAVDEPDETVVLKLSNASNATIGTATATGTITDDDDEPSLSIAASAAVTEGDSGSTDMVFTITLAPASDQEVTVEYGVDTIASTATADTDFTDLSGTLTFAAGETSRTITVSVTGDAVDEPDETVVLKLSNASNATIGTATATGTITDDDDGPSLSIAASAAVTEGNSGSTNMVFAVTLAPASGQEVTVDYGVDASSTATADTDFTDLSGTLTFAVGETSKTITVSVTGDAVDEPDETVVLKLSNASNATIGTATATGTITDDDEPEVHKEKAPQAEARKEELAALSRTTLSIATDMIGERIGGEFSGGAGSVGEQALGVMENLLGFSHGSELSTNLSLEQLGEQLWSESFHISQSDSGSSQQDWAVTSEQQGHWSLWGAGELRSFNGDDDSDAQDLSYSGSMRAGWLGADYQFSNSWLAGLALSFSSAESNYNYRLGSDASDAGSGKTETQLTTFYPYGSFQLTERLMLWGTVGIGFGDLQHQSDGADQEQDGELKVQLAAIGFEQKLSSLAAWQFSLAGDLGIVKSSTEWQDNAGLEDQSISITRARLGVNSSFPFTENTTAYLNLKGRLDGGDLQMGAAEVLLGLRYRTGRFSALLQGRQTYAFDGTYSESGILGQLRFSSQQDGTGLVLQLQPSYGPYGEVGGEQASLWSDQQLNALTGWNGDGQQQGGAMALKSTMGYGFRLPDSNVLLTPFAEVAFTEESNQQTSLGISMEGSSWQVKLTGSREQSSTAPIGTVKVMFSKQL